MKKEKNKQKKTKGLYTHLSFEERFVIEKLLESMVKIREIAKFLGRSPNTISREIRKNQVKGVYIAKKANHKAYIKRWRSKRQCLKVSVDRFLCRFVEDKLWLKWSPEQISGYLRDNLNINCSVKAIYKFVESRSLNHLLFWSWNNKKSGRKDYRCNNPKDNRKYIDERPILSEFGHFELDFIISKHNSWVLMISVDRLTKETRILKLPNRKREAINFALSSMFSGIEIKSITTDNDIAFVYWREIETLLNTQVYFTHPYHSWEKGLVENTNRWIRCFIFKRRDISTVTQEEIDQILSFLNDRPRKIIGFRTPREYTLTLQALSYFGG